MCIAKRSSLLATPLILVLAPFLRSAVQEEPAPPRGVIISMRDGSTVPPAVLAQELATLDVVFLGEDHDNDAGHALQLEILRELSVRGTNLAVSMEMFERDVQGILDEYLAGRVSEEVFLAGSRPWPNYATHYRPIVEFAREQRIPVIAANVPRDVASLISRGETPDASMAPFCPRTTTAPQDLYWQKFAAAMQGHGGTGTGFAMEQYYRSQCLKDDAMAESIADFLARHRHRPVTVVHLCGKFHSDFGLGTAARVIARNGVLRMGILSTETGDAASFDYRKHASRCHYMMVVPPQPPASASVDSGAEGAAKETESKTVPAADQASK